MNNTSNTTTSTSSWGTALDEPHFLDSTDLEFQGLSHHQQDKVVYESEDDPYEQNNHQHEVSPVSSISTPPPPLLEDHALFRDDEPVPLPWDKKIAESNAFPGVRCHVVNQEYDDCDSVIVSDGDNEDENETSFTTLSASSNTRKGSNRDHTRAHSLTIQTTFPSPSHVHHQRAQSALPSISYEKDEELTQERSFGKKIGSFFTQIMRRRSSSNTSNSSDTQEPQLDSTITHEQLQQARKEDTGNEMDMTKAVDIVQETEMVKSIPNTHLGAPNDVDITRKDNVEYMNDKGHHPSSPSHQLETTAEINTFFTTLWGTSEHEKGTQTHLNERESTLPTTTDAEEEKEALPNK